MRTSHSIRHTLRPTFALLLIASLTIVLGAQERDRSKVPDKFNWNLADI